MIKIQKKDFDLENEIKSIKEKYSSIGAVNSFIGYVKDFNEYKEVKFLEIEVYEQMAVNELSKIRKNAIEKFNLIDSLIIHRYGKLNVNEKIVLVVCFSVHRHDSFEATKFIMDYLKKDAPFWKKETYDSESNWIKNIT